MAKKAAAKSEAVGTRSTASQTSSARGKVRDAVESVLTARQTPSALVDTRVIYCGDNLEQLQKLPDAFFISFDYSDDPLREIDRFFKADHAVIIPLSVKEILDEQIARKLA